MAAITLCMALVLPLLWQALEDTSNQYTRNLLDDEKAMDLNTCMPAVASSVMIKACFAGHCVPSVTWMILDLILLKFSSWKCLAISYSYTSLPLSECEMKLSSLPACCFPEYTCQAEMIYIILQAACCQILLIYIYCSSWKPPKQTQRGNQN